MLQKLSVIIPVFNEAATVAQLLERLFAVDFGGMELEVIVVDDASTDASPRLLAELRQRYEFAYLRHARNQGKGAAVRTGLRVASGEAVLIQDADLEYDPADIPALLAALSGHEAVLGSRMMHGTQGGYPHYIWGAKFLTRLINFLFRSSLTDPYTCYKLVNREVLSGLNLTASGFELEAEIVSKLLKAGYPIVEVPVRYHPRGFSEGKKVRALDAWRGAVMVWRVWQ